MDILALANQPPFPPLFPLACPSASFPKYCALKLRIASPALRRVSPFLCSLVNANLLGSVLFHSLAFGRWMGDSSRFVVDGLVVGGGEEEVESGIGGESCSAQPSHGHSA